MRRADQLKSVQAASRLKYCIFSGDYYIAMSEAQTVKGVGERGRTQFHILTWHYIVEVNPSESAAAGNEGNHVT